MTMITYDDNSDTNNDVCNIENNDSNWGGDGEEDDGINHEGYDDSKDER